MLKERLIFCPRLIFGQAMRDNADARRRLEQQATDIAAKLVEKAEAAVDLPEFQKVIQVLEE